MKSRLTRWFRPIGAFAGLVLVMFFFVQCKDSTGAGGECSDSGGGNNRLHLVNISQTGGISVALDYTGGSCTVSDLGTGMGVNVVIDASHGETIEIAATQGGITGGTTCVVRQDAPIGSSKIQTFANVLAGSPPTVMCSDGLDPVP